MLFKNKTIALIAVLLCLSLVLASCGGSPSSSSAPEAPASTDASNEDDSAPVNENSNENVEYIGTFDKNCEGPILITSIGQSADISMLDQIMGKVGIEFTKNETASANEAESAKTIIIAAGASSKGLGAAGISTEEELKRGEEIIAAAKENGAVIIAVHLGGAGRRGELSDQFTDLAFEAADYIIMVKDGDGDGKYSGLAKDKDIPIALTKSVAASVEPIEKALA